MAELSALARRVRERRKALNMNQGDLAAAIKTTQAAISYYESGETNPTADVLVELARVLDASADWLLGLSNEIRPDRMDTMGLTITEQEILQGIRAFPEDQHQFLLDLLNMVRKIAL